MTHNPCEMRFLRERERGTAKRCDSSLSVRIMLAELDGGGAQRSPKHRALPAGRAPWDLSTSQHPSSTRPPLLLFLSISHRSSILIVLTRCSCPSRRAPSPQPYRQSPTRRRSARPRRQPAAVLLPTEQSHPPLPTLARPD